MSLTVGTVPTGRDISDLRLELIRARDGPPTLAAAGAAARRAGIVAATASGLVPGCGEAVASLRIGGRIGCWKQQDCCGGTLAGGGNEGSTRCAQGQHV